MVITCFWNTTWLKKLIKFNFLALKFLFKYDQRRKINQIFENLNEFYLNLKQFYLLPKI